MNLQGRNRVRGCCGVGHQAAYSPSVDLSRPAAEEPDVGAGCPPLDSVSAARSGAAAAAASAES